MRKLRHLYISGAEHDYDVNEPLPENFALPATLVSLALKLVYLPNESLPKILTAGLTTLSIPESDYVLKNCVEILSPTNVTSLSFVPGKNDPNWEDIGESRFPSRITNLSMSSLPSADKIFFPEGLLAFSRNPQRNS